VSVIQEYLPFLIPLIAAQFILAAIAVVHIVKHPRYRFGNKPLWITVACLVQFIGPVVYFAFGREAD
jgi:hypothetical protein